MDNFPFASRTDWIQQPNALNQLLESLRARNVSILDLTESNPTRAGLVYPQSLMTFLNTRENLKYTADSKGLPTAREAVSNFYAKRGCQIAINEIVLTSSTSEAYSFLLRLLVNPGGKVLIPKPSYPLFQFLLELNDCEFDYYPVIYDNGWRLDRDALEFIVDAETRAIIVVNPNNPTGSYLSVEDLKFLNDLCHKKDIAIISDEVFFDYAWGKGNYASCAGNKGALTFTLGGLSKAMALPQMKCSWILASGPEQVVQEAMNRLEIIADTYLSVNTPVQNALPHWLTYAQEIQDQIMRRVRGNWEIVKSSLNANVELLSTEGGWYAVIKIPSTHSEEEWILKFLKEDHVLVHPGYFFDFEDEAYIIVSLLTQQKDLSEALPKIMKRIHS